MEKNRFWELLAKVRAGEGTPEEQLELNQHLSVCPGDLELARQVEAYWDVPMTAASAPDEAATMVAWDRVRYKMADQQPRPELPDSRRKIKRIIQYASAIAACLIVALGGMGWWKKVQVPATPQKSIVSTKNGCKSTIELPDGTKVWLNADSRIKYDENYGKENRELTLTGEAYFDVAHDAKKPFILHTGKMDIKVLGTAFNVKAYPGDGITEAALIRGSIEVTFPGRPQEKLILKPRDKISILNKEANTVKDTARPSYAVSDERPAIMVSSIQYAPVDSAVIETAWVNNKLIFRKKTFEELSRDIERWFNVTIQVKDTSILSKQFTGTFSNESITDALEALSLSYPFHYKLNRSTNIVTIFE
jgi:transmembrane sensor